MWKKLAAVIIGILFGYWLIDDFNPDDVKGKRVLITGASTGIGEQLAYHYARLGANVMVTARRENRLKEVVAECRELGHSGGKYHYVVADMADLNFTETVVQETVAKLGGLDHLVLNHIILLKLWHWEGTKDNLTLLDKVLKVNFQSYVHLASHSLPHLEKSRGSIIVVSSLAGKIAQPFVAIYSASKFALDGFFSGLRQELAMRNCDISITLCILGLIGTDNAVNQLQDYGQDYLLSNIRAASPSDTALAIIKSGTARVRQMNYPSTQVMPFVMMRDFFPRVVDFINRFVYTLNS